MSCLKLDKIVKELKITYLKNTSEKNKKTFIAGKDWMVAQSCCHDSFPQRCQWLKCNPSKITAELQKQLNLFLNLQRNEMDTELPKHSWNSFGKITVPEFKNPKAQ